jgi:hypothetical protein
MKIEYAISFFPSGTGWQVILGLFYMHLLFTGSYWSEFRARPLQGMNRIRFVKPAKDDRCNSTW